MQNRQLKQYFLLSFLVFPIYFFSQTKKINLIILNDQEVSKSIYDFKITPINNSSFNESIKGKYIPGDLLLESEDFNKLELVNTNDLEISFTVISTVNQDLVKEIKYNMIIPKIYLNKEYLVINIFNMYNKTSKKRFQKLIKNGKEYYVVIEVPNSMKFD